MIRKSLRTLYISLCMILVLAFFFWGTDQCIMQSQAAKAQPKDTKNMPKMRSTTSADRKAAAKRAKAKGVKVGTIQVALVPGPGGVMVPDYFGASPNYANSPLPMSGVTGITLTNGGSGFAGVTVSITDAGTTGAGATAVLTVTDGAVTGITLMSAGTGYVSPTVTITDAAGSLGAGATASATADATGAITSVGILTGGSGYATPAIAITDSIGTGATAFAAVDDGTVTGVVGAILSITMSNSGTRYINPVVTITDVGGGPVTAATATATIDPLTGLINGYTVLTPGSGYVTPVVTITDIGTPSGLGATASLTATNGVVMAVVPVLAGSGYANPVVIITDIFGGVGVNAAATATSNFLTGAIDGILLTNGGSGYATPTASIASTGSIASGATATATVTGGRVTALALTSSGSGYVNPIVTIADSTIHLPLGSGATATATVGVGGAITGFTNLVGGSGYATPGVTITDAYAGTGSGAAAEATVTNGVVTALTLTSPGSGYMNAPTVAITDIIGGTGIGATAEVTIVSGTIMSITVLTGGSGYSAPIVSITDTTGIGATASATVTNGVITGITIGNGGYGYSATPTINVLDITGTGATFTATVSAIGIVTGGIRKFIDSLPGLTPAGANTLIQANGSGQYIPIATADTTTYSGSDYYEIALVEYSEQMHRDLPATRLRGYVQLETPVNTAVSKHVPLTYPDGSSIMVNGVQVLAVDNPNYLGPLIIANKDVPTRIKFTNFLPVGASGNLFIPTDTTVMGAGMGPDGSNYSQNRGTLHLHGGFTPWVSDGTPHQWVTPLGELTSLPQGVSTQPVPDMSLTSGGGSMTFYYPNQQSARLMFYHDHAYGITRLNVYAGEAAGYLLTDATEKDLVNTGVVPADQIPLVIQDKVFVDANTIGLQDPTWNWGTTSPTPHTGDLWFPHVYMPNQNPWDMSGANAMGRWDYALWFWPPYTGLLAHGTVLNPYATNGPWEPPEIPGTPNPSIVPEAFVDTPVVNGTVYPYVTVNPKPYRFRILNACNDRFLNLQLYQANPQAPTEVKMVPAVAGPNIPADWGMMDGRDGGVPDPTLVGPNMIQIGTEGGFLPAPVVIPNRPVGYNYNRRDIVVLNVQEKALFMGPAERADVIIDFSQYAGKTLILYNDSPAPVPAFDPRNDYYTGNPDLTSMGGTPTTLPGYGPNTRTIMQIRVAAGAGTPFNMAALNNAFASTAATQGVFAKSQDPIIVPQAPYNSAYNGSFSTNAYVRIQDTNFTFTTLNGATLNNFPLQPKAIQELFELDYGRMNATLGIELPFTNAGNQTTIPLGYVDPPSENINSSAAISSPAAGDGTQIWKITHNGVDTHAIHFHLFNVQLLNRVGWDGAVRPPDDNELGWKETVKMNPLEDAIVALRPTTPQLPFGLPDSVRSYDVTMLPTATISTFNITTGQATTVSNQPVNFGWEYVWHCHLLGHEENDMMRPIVFNVPRTLPVAPGLSATPGTGTTVSLTWTDGTPNGLPLGSSASEIGFKVYRAIVANNGKIGVYTMLSTILANQTTYVDTTAGIGTYSYYVTAYDAAGNSNSNTITVAIPAAPTGLTATLQSGPKVLLTWTDNANNETGFVVERNANGVGFSTLASVAPKNNTGSVSYTDTTVTANNIYDYRVKTVSGAFSSIYSNIAIVSVLLPAAPSGLTATATRGNGNNDTVTLNWTDNANNETGFTIQRATNAAFTTGLTTSTVAANVITFTTGNVARTTKYYFRIQANNLAGSSAWVNATPFPVLTP